MKARSQRGQAVVEYALLLVCCALTLAAALALLRLVLDAYWSELCFHLAFPFP